MVKPAMLPRAALRRTEPTCSGAIGRKAGGTVGEGKR